MTSPRADTVIILLAVVVVVAVAVVSPATIGRLSAEATPDEPSAKHNEQRPQNALLVDTKYWIRDTNFGAKSNWFNHLKPCSLIERIQVDERAVISLGDPLDALGAPIEAHIRDLVLAIDGLLLLEDDSLQLGQDTLLAQYLNQSGDCFDGQTAGSLTQAHQSQPDETLFRFQLDSDDLSWFNSANWLSEVYQDLREMEHFIPDAHSIPCVEDVVVFGSHPSPDIQAHEFRRYFNEIKSFKVNFRPSETMQHQLANVSLTGIRISKLKIGDLFYNQQQFDQLINSDTYGNILFELNDNRSALKSAANKFPNDVNGHFPAAQSPILIDESSIREVPLGDLCLDEAGCLCGNEDENVMQLICSFNYPTPTDKLPCFDPITSSGYCDKICATSLTITMDPSKFKENFLIDMYTKLEAQFGGGSLFIGNRRIDHRKYEVTIRPVPVEEDLGNYEAQLGREIELAQMVKDKLEHGAIKSFYGIKSVNIRSSVEWRRSNRVKVFWISSLFILPLVIIVLTKYENDKFKKILINLPSELITKYEFASKFSQQKDDQQHMCKRALILNEIQPVVEQLDERICPSPEIALMELDSQVTLSSVGGGDCAEVNFHVNHTDKSISLDPENRGSSQLS